MVASIKIIKTDLGRNLDKALKELSNISVRIGWNQTARYDGNVVGEFGPLRPVQVAQVAYWNEMGVPSKNIPARPFLSPTIKEKTNSWQKIASNKSKKIITGQSTVRDLFELIGLKVQEDITKKIKSIWSPPLSKSTIQARMNRYSNDSNLKESTRKQRKAKLKKFVSTGFYKPLQDTGHMLDTLTFEVIES